jgi:PAS domain S-box-containing protein
MVVKPNRSQQKIDELEFIINNIPDLVIRVDPSGRINFMNAASTLFFSHLPEELTGQDLFELLEEQGINYPDLERLRDSFETRQAGIVEASIRAPNDESMFLEIRILPEPPVYPEPHLVLLVRDVTRRKEAERQIILARIKAEKNDQMKSAFLANMSHEIRTPLNAIVGFSQILLDDGITAKEQEQFYEYINQNSNLLINLVNDIIDLSKLESNQMLVREVEVDLNAVMEEMKVLAGNEKKIRDKGHLMIFVDKEITDDKARVLTDGFRLKQIISNLLINAIKFTTKGYIQFGYRLQDNLTLLFYVRDTGIGIPRNRQQEVFQYFHQIDNAVTLANTGTGLGLAICKRLVELMGGSIWLESETGRGTTFFFTLPYRKA